MKGTRPLDNHEIRRVSACFTGTFEARNRGLFMLGVSTGGRISELLSLTIGDVYQNRAPVTDLLYNRAIVKGGEVSRAVPVNRDGRQAIADKEWQAIIKKNDRPEIDHSAKVGDNIEATLRNGLVVKGIVIWNSRYTMVLRVGGTKEERGKVVLLYKHALHEFNVITPPEVSNPNSEADFSNEGP